MSSTVETGVRLRPWSEQERWMLQGLYLQRESLAVNSSQNPSGDSSRSHHNRPAGRNRNSFKLANAHAVTIDRDTLCVTLQSPSSLLLDNVSVATASMLLAQQSTVTTATSATSPTSKSVTVKSTEADGRGVTPQSITPVVSPASSPRASPRKTRATKATSPRAKPKPSSEQIFSVDLLLDHEEHSEQALVNDLVSGALAGGGTLSGLVAVGGALSGKSHCLWGKLAGEDKRAGLFHRLVKTAFQALETYEEQVSKTRRHSLSLAQVHHHQYGLELSLAYGYGSDVFDLLNPYELDGCGGGSGLSAKSRIRDSRVIGAFVEGTSSHLALDMKSVNDLFLDGMAVRRIIRLAHNHLPHLGDIYATIRIVRSARPFGKSKKSSVTSSSKLDQIKGDGRNGSGGDGGGGGGEAAGSVDGASASSGCTCIGQLVVMEIGTSSSALMPPGRASAGAGSSATNGVAPSSTVAGSGGGGEISDRLAGAFSNFNSLSAVGSVAIAVTKAVEVLSACKTGGSGGAGAGVKVLGPVLKPEVVRKRQRAWVSRVENAVRASTVSYLTKDLLLGPGGKVVWLGCVSPRADELRDSLVTMQLLHDIRSMRQMVTTALSPSSFGVDDGVIGRGDGDGGTAAAANIKGYGSGSGAVLDFLQSLQCAPPPMQTGKLKEYIVNWEAFLKFRSAEQELQLNEMKERRQLIDPMAEAARLSSDREDKKRLMALSRRSAFMLASLETRQEQTVRWADARRKWIGKSGWQINAENQADRGGGGGSSNSDRGEHSGAGSRNGRRRHADNTNSQHSPPSRDGGGDDRDDSRGTTPSSAEEEQQPQQQWYLLNRCNEDMTDGLLKIEVWAGVDTSLGRLSRRDVIAARTSSAQSARLVPPPLPPPPMSPAGSPELEGGGKGRDIQQTSLNSTSTGAATSWPAASGPPAMIAVRHGGSVMQSCHCWLTVVVSSAASVVKGRVGTGGGDGANDDDPADSSGSGGGGGSRRGAKRSRPYIHVEGKDTVVHVNGKAVRCPPPPPHPPPGLRGLGGGSGSHKLSGSGGRTKSGDGSRGSSGGGNLTKAIPLYARDTLVLPGGVVYEVVCDEPRGRWGRGKDEGQEVQAWRSPLRDGHGNGHADCTSTETHGLTHPGKDKDKGYSYNKFSGSFWYEAVKLATSEPLQQLLRLGEVYSDESSHQDIASNNVSMRKAKAAGRSNKSKGENANGRAGGRDSDKTQMNANKTLAAAATRDVSSIASSSVVTDDDDDEDDAGDDHRAGSGADDGDGDGGNGDGGCIDDVVAFNAGGDGSCPVDVLLILLLILEANACADTVGKALKFTLHGRTVAHPQTGNAATSQFNSAATRAEPCAGGVAKSLMVLSITVAAYSQHRHRLTSYGGSGSGGGGGNADPPMTWSCGQFFSRMALITQAARSITQLSTALAPSPAVFGSTSVAVATAPEDDPATPLTSNFSCRGGNDGSGALGGIRGIDVMEEYAARYPPEKDPFYDPPGHELVGIGQCLLDPLVYLLDINTALPLVNFKGDFAGELDIRIVPSLADDGVVDTGKLKDVVVYQPKEVNLRSLLGEMLHLQFHIGQVRGLPADVCTNGYVQFNFFLNDRPYVTPQSGLTDANPVFDYASFTEARVTSDLVSYLAKNAMQVEVWAARLSKLEAKLKDLESTSSVYGCPLDNPLVFIVPDMSKVIFFDTENEAGGGGGGVRVGVTQGVTLMSSREGVDGGAPAGGGGDGGTTAQTALSAASKKEKLQQQRSLMSFPGLGGGDYGSVFSNGQRGIDSDDDDRGAGGSVGDDEADDEQEGESTLDLAELKRELAQAQQKLKVKTEVAAKAAASFKETITKLQKALDESKAETQEVERILAAKRQEEENYLLSLTAHEEMKNTKSKTCIVQ